MQSIEQEINSLQTNVESNEMAIRMLKKKQKNLKRMNLNQNQKIHLVEEQEILK